MIDPTETLCIMCQKSCTGECSWSDRLEPVPGWTAEENRHGYLVIECPEFVKETAESILPKELNEGGMMRLLEAMARQMREDYISGKGLYDCINEQRKHRVHSPAEIRAMNRKIIEKWLKEGKGAKMLNLSNPDEVIMMLRKMARMHDAELTKFLR